MPDGAPSPPAAPFGARLLSIVGHPFVVPPGTALWAALRRGAGAAEIGTLVALLIVTVAVMAAYALRRVRSGRWRHMDASERAERRDLNRFSFAFLSLAATLAFFVLQRPMFAIPLAVAAAMLLVCIAAGRRLKISHHVMFAVLPAGWLWPDGAALCVLAALAAVVAWSRLRLGRHTAREVRGGALLGMAGAAVVAAALS
ncbi:MAG: hypothetical protein QM661_11085 [Solimonas sp.]